MGLGYCITQICCPGSDKLVTAPKVLHPISCKTSNIGQLCSYNVNSQVASTTPGEMEEFGFNHCKLGCKGHKTLTVSLHRFFKLFDRFKNDGIQNPSAV